MLHKLHQITVIYLADKCNISKSTLNNPAKNCRILFPLQSKRLFSKYLLYIDFMLLHPIQVYLKDLEIFTQQRLDSA